jgi:hypothetical protein
MVKIKVAELINVNTTNLLIECDTILQASYALNNVTIVLTELNTLKMKVI